MESYLATGEPVGSRNLSRILPMALSPASVRNVMADLEAAGLIYAPHTSAGRLPTEGGLRFFVDSILEVGDLSQDERAHIDAQVRASAQSRSVEQLLAEASAMLSGLSRGAGVVATTKAAEMQGISMDEAVKRRLAAVPAGRLGTPDEFGQLCAFLAGAKAGYITGQNFLIDGGAFRGTF